MNSIFPPSLQLIQQSPSADLAEIIRRRKPRNGLRHFLLGLLLGAATTYLLLCW